MESTVNPELLQRLAPFCWLSDAQRAAILPHVLRRRYPARAVIQRAGVASDGIHVLICGRISVVHQSAEGHELVAQTIVPRDAFGELGLLDGQTSPAMIRSDIACETAYVPQCVIVRCLEENPAAAVELVRMVAERLSDAHRKLAQIALANVYERVAAAMVANASLENDETVVQVGTEHIARIVASSREMVTRVVNKMLAEGLVRRPGHRRLIVADVDRLRAAAGKAVRSRRDRAPLAGLNPSIPIPTETLFRF